MSKFPVALQLYSVRDFMEQDVEKTLREVKAMGYDGVEFAGLYGYDPADLRALCEEIGLVPISAHVPLAAFEKDLEGTMAAYKTLGCQFVAVPYLSDEFRVGGERYGELTEMIKRIGEEANAQGLTLLYHNHDFEFVKLDNGEYMLDALYRLVSADLLQTQLDTCWVNIGGEVPAEYIRRYAGRAPVVHLKDFVGGKAENMYALIGIDENEEKNTQGAFEFRPVGQGVQDFPTILAAAHEAGTQWVVVEQDSPSDDYTSLECARMSAEYVTTINQ